MAALIVICGFTTLSDFQYPPRALHLLILVIQYHFAVGRRLQPLLFPLSNEQCCAKLAHL